MLDLFVYHLKMVELIILKDLIFIDLDDLHDLDLDDIDLDDLHLIHELVIIWVCSMMQDHVYVDIIHA